MSSYTSHVRSLLISLVIISLTLPLPSVHGSMSLNSNPVTPVFFCVLLVLLFSVHVAQTKLFLSEQDQRVSTAVPVQ